MEINEGDKMEIVESDHLIIAEMLQISSAVEEVSDKYGIKLPQLTINNLISLNNRMKTFPNSKVKQIIEQSIDMYVKLYARLPNYAN